MSVFEEVEAGAIEEQSPREPSHGKKGEPDYRSHKHKKRDMPAVYWGRKLKEVIILRGPTSSGLTKIVKVKSHAFRMSELRHRFELQILDDLPSHDSLPYTAESLSLLEENIYHAVHINHFSV
jgi:hypothetical protein